MVGSVALCFSCKAPLPPSGTELCGVCGTAREPGPAQSSVGLERSLNFGSPLSLGERLAGIATEVGLFIITLGIGWALWFVMTARRGMTPAGKIRDEVFVTRDGRVAGLRILLVRQGVLLLAWAVVVALSTGAATSLSSVDPDWFFVWFVPIVFVAVVLADLLSALLPGHTRYLDRLCGLRIGHGAGHTFHGAS